MIKLVSIQWALLSLFAIFAYLMYGQNHALSALFGGASYAIPTTLSVLFLNLFRNAPAYAGMAFIMAEGLKIVLSLILMITSFVLYPNMHFIPFFVGLLIVSHLVFLSFLKVERYGSK